MVSVRVEPETVHIMLKIAPSHVIIRMLRVNFLGPPALRASMKPAVARTAEMTAIMDPKMHCLR